MNILSLFDGISCGQLALKRAGIVYDNYYASEIDKSAIKITQKNWPKTIQLGNVIEIDFEKLPKIDLLLGGSPCKSFSFSGKQLNFEDPNGKLFFEYVRALKTLRPKYFLFENVKMKKVYMDAISELLEVEPILIDSALVSGQTSKKELNNESQATSWRLFRYITQSGKRISRLSSRRPSLLESCKRKMGLSMEN